jgi:hypothetical protein
MKKTRALRKQLTIELIFPDDIRERIHFSAHREATQIAAHYFEINFADFLEFFEQHLKIKFTNLHSIFKTEQLEQWGFLFLCFSFVLICFGK